MSTYTCPHCGQHDLSTQRRHNCPKLPSLSIPLGPPRSMDPIANVYIDRLTRKLKEARHERSAARAEALTAQASLRRVERELEEVRALLGQYQRLVVFADSVARARGDACGLCDALGRDDQPYQSNRAADLIAEAERALTARTTTTE